MLFHNNTLIIVNVFIIFYIYLVIFMEQHTQNKNEYYGNILTAHFAALTFFEKVGQRVVDLARTGYIYELLALFFLLKDCKNV